MMVMRKKWWLILLALLALGAGVWWWLAPRRYALIATIPTASVQLTPCLTGFLVETTGGSLAFHDWRGGVQWTVPCASGNAGISDDGRYCAVDEGEGAGHVVRLYDDGWPEATVALPASLTTSFQPQVLDDGTVFLECEVRGQRAIGVIAGGRLLPPLPVPGTGRMACAPDGRTVAIGHLEGPQEHIVLHTLSRTRTALRLGTGSRGPGVVIDGDVARLLYRNGAYLDPGTGVVYAPGAAPTPASGWKNGETAPGRGYVLQYRDGASRVFSPVTGDAWRFSVPGDNQGGDTTPDGRFALAYYARPLPAPLQRLLHLAHLPYDRVARDYVACVERPGRVRARLRLDTVDKPGRMCDGRAWYPSPDGHGIVINSMYDVSGECRVYRW
jgi:hypothetical protein